MEWSRTIGGGKLDIVWWEKMDICKHPPRLEGVAEQNGDMAV